MNNSYLQLPNQNDSFRRAHSDSSLNQSVANSANNPQLCMNFQQNTEQTYNQQQQINHIQQQQQQQYQQPIQFQQQFENQIFQAHNVYQQQQPFIPGANEYHAIPFRNLSLPISSQLVPQSPTNFQINPTSPTTIKTEPKVKTISSPTKSNAASPTASLSPTLMSPHHKNVTINSF